jgi:hypothetical protein
MRPALRPPSLPLLLAGCGFVSLLLLAPAGRSAAVPQPSRYWQVEDVRRGMKGHGRTVMQGTKVETFQAEVLGVLKNTSPGRDLILARLSGLNLEKTGVIAGMSGSPIYIDGKLLGAVAYAWSFGKEPIAGITPFVQMRSAVEALERREVSPEAKPVRVGLAEEVEAGGRSFDAVSVSQGFDEAPAGDGLHLVPLRTPLMATGFTRHSLDLLAKRVGRFGLVPMTGGSATAKVAEEEKDVALEPGGPLAVALITGDFDLSGIGTVTHVEGGRVYGWGHPYMSLGGCQLPMYTGYIHTVYPRQTVSFKMGSPLREVGVLHADVSTCVGGLLDKKADLMPMKIDVRVGGGECRTFHLRVARHRGLLPTLIYTALTNAVDMEGELPEEMTARLHAKIELEGRQPVVIHDTFSGFSGGRAPQVLYSQVALTASQLVFNSFEDLQIKRITCETRVEPGRSTAEVESVTLDADHYRPGDTVTATATLRLYKGGRQRVRLKLKLPEDLPEGSHTATLCDELASARLDLRGDPALYGPTSAAQVLDGLKVLLDARRTTLALRLPLGAHGVAAGGKSLPRLPSSMVHILTHGKRSGATTMTRALLARERTDWVIQGAESVTFQVTKTRRATRQED